MESPDFTEIATSIDAYEPPAGHAPARVRGPASYETLRDLTHEMKNRAVEPEKCAFYIHPEVWHELWDDSDSAAGWLSEGQAFARPIVSNPTMPKHTILFMAPDAVTLGGTVVNPLAIAFAELTTDD